MAYCEVTKRECPEMTAQEELAMTLGIVTDTPSAHHLATIACKEGLNSMTDTTRAWEACGLVVLDELEDQNA